MKQILIPFLIFCTSIVNAQNMSKYGYDFDLLPQIIENNDTIIIASALSEVTVMPKPELITLEDKKAFNKLKYHTLKVYHYAQTAKEIYARINEDTEDLKRRSRKRYLNKTEKELKEQFSGELKNLSRSSGRVLVKLINRETGNNCYGLIKEIKSGLAAFFWQRVAKLYKYNLKTPYVAKDNKDLEYIIYMIEIGVYKLPETRQNS